MLCCLFRRLRRNKVRASFVICFSNCGWQYELVFSLTKSKYFFSLIPNTVHIRNPQPLFAHSTQQRCEEPSLPSDWWSISVCNKASSPFQTKPQCLFACEEEMCGFMCWVYCFNRADHVHIHVHTYVHVCLKYRWYSLRKRPWLCSAWW